MARASSTRSPKSRPSTFSPTLNKLLKPILTGAKREAQIEAAPGVRGKPVTLASGQLCLFVETKGKDIWRGGAKSIHEAIEKGSAGLSVDNVVLQRAQKLGCTLVAIVCEEHALILMAPITSFFDPVNVRTRANFRGRAMRILPITSFQHRYLNPPLKKRRKRVIAC